MTSQLFVLEPKYLACRPAGITTSPLGTILVADITGEAGVVAVIEAAARVAAEPWCPVVLLSRSAELSRTVEAVVDQFDMAPAMATLPGEANLLSPEHILAAVNGRQAPSPGRLAGYVVSRTAKPNVRSLLEECFRRGTSQEIRQESYSRSTLYRRLSGFGPFKPHDWTSLSQTLSLLLASGSLRNLSMANEIDPRTVQARVQRFTGIDFRQARRLSGWEWVIESGLRRAGYVEGGPQQDATWGIGRSG